MVILYEKYNEFAFSVASKSNYMFVVCAKCSLRIPNSNYDLVYFKRLHA
jgi:hypothetical protein